MLYEVITEKEKNYNIRGEFVDFKGDVVASYDLGALTLKSGTQQDKTFSIIPKKRGSFTLFIKAVERESGPGRGTGWCVTDSGIAADIRQGKGT